MNSAVIVEPRKIRQTIDVLYRFYNKLNTNWKFYLFCGKNTTEWWQSKIDFPIDIIELETDNLTSTDYNDLLKTVSFWNSIQGEYVLIFQTDTWLNDNPIYDIDYFVKKEYSYVGGNMSYMWAEMSILHSFNISYKEYGNYNGGLSLRKRKDMLQILNQYPPEPTMPYICMEVTEENKTEIVGRTAEDVYFTLGCYLLNLKIGIEEECSYFACHTVYRQGCFGFHLSSPCKCIVDKCRAECPSLGCYFKYCTSENKVCSSCPIQSSKIAIYQGYPHFHYECIGYIVEYCKRYCLDFVIYCQVHDRQSDMWMDFYNELFQIDVSYWKDPSSFYPDEFDKIFLVTDDDSSFQGGWYQVGSEKVICINHYYENRRHNLKYYIGTRYFPNAPTMKWAYQMYRAITKTEKTNILLSNNKKYIVCIGESHPENNVLEKIFENSQDFEFIVISRRIHHTSIHENVKYYLNLYQPLFFEILKKASYILCMDSSKNRTDSCTGAISMAFSFGCGIILPDTWQHHFQFKTAISYSTSYLYKINIPYMSIQRIHSIYQEQTEYIENRNQIFHQVVFPNS
jgi:hypothetical protein